MSCSSVKGTRRSPRFAHDFVEPFSRSPKLGGRDCSRPPCRTHIRRPTTTHSAGRGPRFPFYISPGGASPSCRLPPPHPHHRLRADAAPPHPLLRGSPLTHYPDRPHRHTTHTLLQALYRKPILNSRPNCQHAHRDRGILAPAAIPRSAAIAPLHPSAMPRF